MSYSQNDRFIPRRFNLRMSNKDEVYQLFERPTGDHGDSWWLLQCTRVCIYFRGKSLPYAVCLSKSLSLSTHCAFAVICALCRPHLWDCNLTSCGSARCVRRLQVYESHADERSARLKSKCLQYSMRSLVFMPAAAAATSHTIKFYRFPEWNERNQKTHTHTARFTPRIHYGGLPCCICLNFPSCVAMWKWNH